MKRFRHHIAEQALQDYRTDLAAFSIDLARAWGAGSSLRATPCAAETVHFFGTAMLNSIVSLNFPLGSSRKGGTGPKGCASRIAFITDSSIVA